MRILILIVTAFLLSLTAIGCIPDANQRAVVPDPTGYAWSRVTDRASYPEGYNYPVFTFGNWMVAMNNGAWLSTDGRKWVKTDLPESGLNSGYQKYVQFKGSIYALGTMQGNYLNMKLSSKIARTRNFRTWETVAERSNLPDRVFYGATVFKDKIWLLGGYDGKNYFNDVWNSSDGATWQRVTDRAAWSPRLARTMTVFKNKLWLIGGGVIDGEKEINPNSTREIWSSEDGIEWTSVKPKTDKTGSWGSSPVVFDGKLWLVGANRSDGNFGNAVLDTDDGVTWETRSAPWTPRGAAAAWVAGDKLFMTGGKYSYTENGATRFVYSNDVWAMSKTMEKEDDH